jgi:hypothetical protein
MSCLSTSTVHGPPVNPTEVHGQLAQILGVILQPSGVTELLAKASELCESPLIQCVIAICSFVIDRDLESTLRAYPRLTPSLISTRAS